MARLVIVDDDPAIHDLLQVFFQNFGHQVRCFENITDTAHYVIEHGSTVDLIISDLRLPDGTGLSLMPLLKENGLDLPLILITAFGSAEIAANALKQGIFDYITKPLNLTELEVICNRALQLKSMEKSLLELRANVDFGRHSFGLIGHSTIMHELFEKIEKVAVTTSNILITGESGTGKELVARAIHNRGHRHSYPFMAVNCSAIPGELLESELFGYKKGAFTGAAEAHQGLLETAEGGTLFLDEIGDMPLLLQAKLLRVLQERTVRRLGESADRPINVRVISATHRDLKAAAHNKEFREDLYFRLNVIPLTLPPLRERKEDIPLLASFFLRKFALINEKPISGFTTAAINALTSAQWPGNVRELENTIERAVALSTTKTLDVADLGLEQEFSRPPTGEPVFARHITLRQLEREYITHILATTRGKKEDVAAILGIDRKTLYRKQRDYNLT